MATKRQKRKRRQARPAKQTPTTEPSAVAADDARRSATARRRGALDAPPPPPWGSFPLSEIVVLVALILIVVSFFAGSPQGAVMFGVGLLLGSLAGLELAAREHFAGYRSHTTLLAGFIGIVVVVAAVLLTELQPIICAGFGLAAAGAAAFPFARAFRRASGGSLYKIAR